MATVDVNLPGRAYTIEIGAGMLRQFATRLRERCDAQVATIITDSNVGPLYAEEMADSLSTAGFDVATLTVPAGEASKSLQQATELYDRLAELHRGRSDPIIALGGGVVGDLAGFTAATWMRGVPLVQYPTTLEAAIDAGVGGKTAVNHASGKNMIGAFHQPILVWIDIDCLRTLSDRDYRAALAESVKHAVLSGEAFMRWHEEHAAAILSREPATVAELIRRNCEIKAAIVVADERETSAFGADPASHSTSCPVGRTALNLGHTIGHAIESQCEYELRHGEAVALGIIAGMDLAVGHAGFPESSRDRIESLLNTLGLPIRLQRSIQVADLIRRMMSDKKSRRQSLRFVLPQRLGSLRWIEDPSEKALRQAIERIAAP